MTTVEEIADAAAISPRTFFRYFPSKEDVVIWDEYDPLAPDLLASRPDDEPLAETFRALVRFLEHRIADRRVLRLIQKWLRAGVIEDGAWSASEEGSPQGATISPLLANVYLHYVFDLWAQQWRKRHARGQPAPPWMRPSFLTSMCTSSPGRARS
jgi:AcrR family transcriptional regulator